MRVRVREGAGGIRILLAALWLAAFAACGYHPLYGGTASEKLSVVLVRGAVADSVAAGDVAAGVREELARDGALAPGSGYPRVEIEVTRIDEASDAIGSVTSASGSRTPLARATDVAVVARAWVKRQAGGTEERDTGDVRALAVTGATIAAENTRSADATGIDTLRHDDAVRAAARQTGIRLAQRILGRPAPETDLLDDPRAPGP